MKSEKTYIEHPFAQYVRILGKGKKGSRSLTFEEAKSAMGMILRDEVLPEQLGAFLMLLRVKEETGEELAGFVSAVKDQIDAPININVDLDWSSYAGKRRHLPWFIFSILLLAENNHKVFIHGASGHTADRIYTDDIFNELGLDIANSWQEVEAQIEKNNFAFMPLENISPKLNDMINLRPIMGLRSPVHSLSRLINPLNSDFILQGIFHPPYSGLHQVAGKLLNYKRLAVIKGEGGEIERNPDNDMVVKIAEQGVETEETWPALFERRHVKGKDLTPEYLKQVWRGKVEDEYGQAACVSTLALALRTLNDDLSQTDALDTANTYWENRNKTRF